MALNHLEFYSKELAMRTRVNIILPEHPKKNLPILLLLHGLGDDENVWLEQTKLVAYAADQQVAIIMPRVDRSYYTNEINGSAYFDYLSELLTRCRSWFHLTMQQERTFVAGVSMGGFGALKLALNRPELIRKAYLLSAMVNIKKSWQSNPDREAWYHSLFGTIKQITGTENDFETLISNWSVETAKPQFLQICGDSDPFLDINQQLHQLLIKKQFKDCLRVVSGTHEWRVWDNAIQSVLEDIAKNI